VRATREAAVRHNGESLQAIVGIPMRGETVDGEVFDGETEAAIFPGELPADPKRVFRGDGLALPETDADWRFARFRPPLIAAPVDGKQAPLPHIRMDRALEFLLGDRLI
jgi:predicted YcjX-like family ATPase